MKMYICQFECTLKNIAKRCRLFIAIIYFCIQENIMALNSLCSLGCIQTDRCTFSWSFSAAFIYINILFLNTEVNNTSN